MGQDKKIWIASPFSERIGIYDQTKNMVLTKDGREKFKRINFDFSV